MCKWEPGEPWWSYAFRQLCEKSMAAFVVVAFGVLFWYADKAEKQQNALIELIHQSNQAQAATAEALHELIFYIKKQ